MEHLEDITKHFDEADHDNVRKDCDAMVKSGRFTKLRKGHYTLKVAA